MQQYRLITREGTVIHNYEGSLDALADKVDPFVAKYGRVEVQRFDPEMRHWYSTGTYFGKKAALMGWTLRRADGTTKPLSVPARTQAQRDAAKANVENPPPPSNHKRHGQLESLR